MSEWMCAICWHACVLALWIGYVCMIDEFSPMHDRVVEPSNLIGPQTRMICIAMSLLVENHGGKIKNVWLGRRSLLESDHSLCNPHIQAFCHISRKWRFLIRCHRSWLSSRTSRALRTGWTVWIGSSHDRVISSQYQNLCFVLPWRAIQLVITRI